MRALTGIVETLCGSPELAQLGGSTVREPGLCAAYRVEDRVVHIINHILQRAREHKVVEVATL